VRLTPLAVLCVLALVRTQADGANPPLSRYPYAVVATYTLGGAGGWDYLSVDAARNRLFIARSDRVLVVSTLDGSLVGTIADTEGVHGIALAPDLGRAFTSNGRANTVTVFDLATLAPLEVIAVKGENPDAILYDPAAQRVFTFNGRSHDITAIDAHDDHVLASFPAGGKPEFAATDGSGRIYYNIEDAAELGVIDSRKMKRVATWALAHCESPTGLALDVAHRRLFSVCANGAMAVTDADSGRSVATVPIGKGPDAAAFDAERGLIFSSNGADGTLTVIHEDDADNYSVVATVPTQKSARTLALDSRTHRLYLVAAEFGNAPPPTEAQAHPRPPVRAGTFKVLVLDSRAAGGP
jgi:DNA-binding beta-propeller fold protein YncE